MLPDVYSREIGTGTPLVLLHGFGVDHRILLPLDPTFERAGGWRRIYLDLPGATGTPIGAVESAADVAHAVQDEITIRLGDEPFAILGNSFGGMIARQVAHRLRPQVLGLATMAGLFVSDHSRRTVPEKTVIRTSPEALRTAGTASDGYAEMAVIQSVENAQAFLDYVLPGLDGADQAALERISARYDLPQGPEARHADPFTQPSLHITAKQDQVVGFQDAWAQIEHYPRATFAVLDAAGHNVHLDQPTLTAALITDWLQRIREAA